MTPALRSMTCRRPLWLILLTASLLGLSAGCVSPPVRNAQEVTTSLPPTESGFLYEQSHEIEAELAAGQSAFWLLDRADFSFEARLALVDRAESSLDIQYFIWEKDPSSRLFSDRVLRAAERGVRVRLLLDDLTLNGQDGEFYALSQHPNIDVRTFNPWNSRSNLGRVTEFFLRSQDLNHRMHNKIVLADGQFSITGGRNIGDRYFGVFDRFVQNDLDVLAVGPIVAEVAASFDLYWNSEDAYPLDDVVSRKAKQEQLGEITQFIEQAYQSERNRLMAFPLEPVTWDEFFENLSSSYAAGAGRLEQDLPTIDEASPAQLYAPLRDFVAQARERVIVSSPYLAPDEEFFEMLAGLRNRGVEIVILTNSLASNNHMIAHSAYKRWRKRLLRIGVELYEAREDSPVIESYSAPPVSPGFLGLHSKALVVDDRWSFIGSPNIDPRSLELNTEFGFFIESPELATRLRALLERDLTPDAAWRVELDDRGRLSWTSSAGTVMRQPALGTKQRFMEFFLNMLPFKDQV